MMSALVAVPAITSMVSSPENVLPGDGIEYVPATSNVFAFAVPKLNAVAHNTLTSVALIFNFMSVPPLDRMPQP
jgi:hypothetical protein